MQISIRDVVPIIKVSVDVLRITISVAMVGKVVLVVVEERDMNVGDTVYLRQRVEDCGFFPMLQQTDNMKANWYKNWWASHLNKPATIVAISKDTLYVQFEEGGKYIMSTAYLA